MESYKRSRSFRAKGADATERIIVVLRESREPLAVQTIQKKIGYGDWEATKSKLLEMCLLGHIEGFHTPNGWFFRTIKKEKYKTDTVEDTPATMPSGDPSSVSEG